jgi:hypothetical protein
VQKLHFGLVFLAVFSAAGCGSTPSAPAGTGAKETAQRFFDAVVRKEWETAYATLHPDEQAKISREEFLQRATTFRRHLGFEPGGVQVWACDERADGATAHVTLSGVTPQSHKQFKDAVALRRTSDGWGVVPSPKFGRPP